jgi:hypothetical protein
MNDLGPMKGLRPFIGPLGVGGGGSRAGLWKPRARGSIPLPSTNPI